MRTLLSATLVKDINAMTRDSSPSNFVQCGANVFFTATDASRGTELWISDGTTAGSRLVKDINPGVNSSGIAQVTAAGSLVYFVATDGTNGSELWRSDGTASGTFMLRDINPGSGGSTLTVLSPVGSSLYFSAVNLWVTDGSTGGTVELTQGGGIIGLSATRPLPVMNGWLYFGARDGTHGTELWRTNGTAAQTTFFADVWTGFSSSLPSNLTVAGNRLYFTATDQTATTGTGTELYSTDGVTTSLAKDIRAGTSSSSPSRLAAMGNAVFFAADDGTTGSELWRSDGTSGGTFRVADIRTGSGSSTPLNLTVVGGNTLYFTASDAVHGIEVWRSDAAGTSASLVADIWAGTGESDPSGLTALGNQLLFAAWDSAGGKELWKANASGANRVADLSSGTASSFGADVELVPFNGQVYFNATNGTTEGIYRSDGNSIAFANLVTFPTAPHTAAGAYLFAKNGAQAGIELWKADGGSTTSQALLADLDPTPSDSNLQYFYSAGENATHVFFNAVETNNQFATLFVSDGTSAGTHAILSATGERVWIASSNRAAFLPNGVMIFLGGPPGTDMEPWRTDGTSAGTYRLADVFPGAASSNPEWFYAAGNYVYFNGSTGTGATPVYRTDGTVNGTIIAGPGANSFQTTPVGFLNGFMYIAKPLNSSETELYRTDGSANSLTLFKNLAGSSNGAPALGVVSNGLMYFRGNDAVTGNYDGLYVTDGTPNGTTLVQASFANTVKMLGGLTPFQGKLLFSRGDELWMTSGTPATTLKVANVSGAPSSHAITRPFVLGDNAYFFGTHGSADAIWKTDGTTAGTGVLRDLPGSGMLSKVVISDGVAFFSMSASDLTGRLWRTDGTASGTIADDDRTLSGFGGSPSYAICAAGVLAGFFDAAVGWELHVVDPIGTVNGGTLHIAGTSGDDVVSISRAGNVITATVGARSLTISGATNVNALHLGTFNGDDSISVAGFAAMALEIDAGTGTNAIVLRDGSYVASRNLGSTSASASPSLSLSNANVQFNSPQSLRSLFVDASRATLGASGGNLLVIRGALSLIDGGSLDLNDNDLVVTSTPKTVVDGYVSTAYNFGGWDGPGGIFSSTAKNKAIGNTTLGVMSGQEFNDNNGGAFDGYAPSANDVLVKYTYFGDVDFNGRIDVSDYNLIDFGFANHLTSWANGDADWSGGATDVSDYNLIDFAFATQGGAL